MQQPLDALSELPDQELLAASSRVCAQGKDMWMLSANDIDHEKIHVGQGLEGRYESRLTPTP